MSLETGLLLSPVTCFSLISLSLQEIITESQSTTTTAPVSTTTTSWTDVSPKSTPVRSSILDRDLMSFLEIPDYNIMIFSRQQSSLWFASRCFTDHHFRKLLSAPVTPHGNKYTNTNTQIQTHEQKYKCKNLYSSKCLAHLVWLFFGGCR